MRVAGGSVNFILPHVRSGRGGAVSVSGDQPARPRGLHHQVGVSLATLILDLAYALLDPRIRTGRA